MPLNHLFIIILGLLFASWAPIHASAASAITAPQKAVENNQLGSLSQSERHLLRIRSTVQAYQFRHPWAKNAPVTRSGIGVILSGGNVLVTAELVANHTYIEAENPRTGERQPVEIVRVDYDSNLALVHLASAFADLSPCELAWNTKSGDPVQILQIQSSGQLNAISGDLTTATVTPYSPGTSPLLLFWVSAASPYRNNDITQPVIRNGKLVGLSMRFDERSQSYEVIPASVIRQFVTDPFEGVPRLGLGTTSTQDPQLRKWLGLSQNGGIYVCRVDENGPAANAGIKRGDVIFSMDGYKIDEQGNIDHPDFGKIHVNYLIGTKHRVGDQVTLKVFRNGTIFDNQVTFAAYPSEKNLSPPYFMDRQPGYFILGGMVFMELSRPYLQEWGVDWKKRAPQRLVYIDQYQKELPQFHGKIVFLSEVLPSENTMGFDNLSNLILTQVNGHSIHSLEDLAKAAAMPINGIQKIEFLEDPHVVYLDAALAVQTDQKLIKDYLIPTTTNIETNSGK